MTSTKQLIVETFSKAFNKYFYNELVIGKLAHSEMKDALNKGDEVDIIMTGNNVSEELYDLADEVTIITTEKK